MKIVAIVLIVLGAISLAYGGISYTTREKVLDIGPIEATAERHKTSRCRRSRRRRGRGRHRLLFVGSKKP